MEISKSVNILLMIVIKWAGQFISFSDIRLNGFRTFSLSSSTKQAISCLSMIKLLFARKPFETAPFSTGTSFSVVNLQSHNSEQLQTRGLSASMRRCKLSRGNWMASNVCKLLPRIEISTRFGLPWNRRSGSSENCLLFSNSNFCRFVLSTNALKWEKIDRKCVNWWIE